MNLNLDFTYLNEISGGDQEFINDILETFLIEMPKDMENVSNGINNNDTQIIGKMAHKVKATLHLLGLEELKNHAFNIEQAAKNNADDNEIIEAAKKLVEYVDLIIPKVKATL